MSAPKIHDLAASIASDLGVPKPPLSAVEERVKSERWAMIELTGFDVQSVETDPLDLIELARRVAIGAVRDHAAGRLERLCEKAISASRQRQRG